MDKNTLSLFQLCDSNFPTGAFSHSYGLESYIQEDQVHDQDTLSKWLHVFLHEQLVHSDGLASRLVYDALQDENFEAVWKMDRMLTVQNLPRETREGTQKMGVRMLSLVGSLYEVPVFSLYQQRMNTKKSFGHPAIVFTMIGHHLGVSQSTTILYYLYSVISSIVQNAVRAIPLGQTTGQKIIQHFQGPLMEATEKILSLDKDEFGVISPGLEISQMQHERVNIRIFMS
ncbi:urease accessory protein UreF [Paenibacillus sp. Marseille-Q4541]|uniref:urease accessory protein UreF n=1 Tax=Paenibacillus sp. Marseille-Q4541 TaxID=2831522 RepID=UPI001BA45D7E|nr:urease accessory protein UreF [Paenibacillus sp. Marseille-Q4541]